MLNSILNCATFETRAHCKLRLDGAPLWFAVSCAVFTHAATVWRGRKCGTNNSREFYITSSLLEVPSQVKSLTANSHTVIAFERNPTKSGPERPKNTMVAKYPGWRFGWRYHYIPGRVANMIATSYLVAIIRQLPHMQVVFQSGFVCVLWLDSYRNYNCKCSSSNSN